ncbi:MAG TPA: aldehyde dehydrogenase family protein [bacterium (Candidatus Stahlbacteria)]|nr:aldehyde dehydrogenase family protein [Candidatus Stahlbacteria bacterium]
MKMIIGGKWIDKDEKIEVKDPQDGKLIDTIPSADTSDVKKAYETAEAGADAMRKLSTYDRYLILKKTAELLEGRLEEYSKTIALEGVKTIREARKEAARAVNTLTYAAEEAKRIEGEIIHIDADYRKESRFGYWIREPVGIVLAITPYNDPLNMVAHKAGPAIAAGNALILKPTYLTPLSALKLGELLLEAGLPENALSIITGKSSNIGDALVEDLRPRVITFTGGVEAGEAVIRKAGLKKVMMELGSSSAVIVMDDADLNLAVPSIVSGSFWAAGQNCIGVQRLYVHKNIYDKFMSEFIDRTAKYKVGDKLDESTDMGPMITEAEANKVESWVNEAIELGGKLLVGGKREGNFYWPTVLENVPKKAKVVCEEIFGPVVVVFSFTTLDEAIEEANDSKYGLHAAIFTKDLDNAFYAARELQFGGIMVNDSTDFRVDYMPFGGYKQSGLHREGLKFAIDIMTEIKLVTINLKR